MAGRSIGPVSHLRGISVSHLPVQHCGFAFLDAASRSWHSISVSRWRSDMMLQCCNMAGVEHCSTALFSVELCGIALMQCCGVALEQRHIGAASVHTLVRQGSIVVSRRRSVMLARRRVGATSQHCVGVISCWCSIGAAQHIVVTAPHQPSVQCCSIMLSQCRALWHRIGAALQHLIGKPACCCSIELMRPGSGALGGLPQHCGGAAAARQHAWR